MKELSSILQGDSVKLLGVPESVLHRTWLLERGWVKEPGVYTHVQIHISYPVFSNMRTPGTPYSSGHSF